MRYGKQRQLQQLVEHDGQATDVLEQQSVSSLMYIKDLITIDPNILGGQAVFAGTRVPVESLFDHLEAGVPLDEFLDDFPTVSREQAMAIMLISGTNTKHYLNDN